MKILIIEDDHEVAGFIQKGMQEAGHQADTTDNGATGLQKASSNDYDVVIVDRMLPGLDGLSIIKTLRGGDNEVPVLILSALGEVDQKVDGLRSGGDDYLVKPFAFAELLARVEVLYQRRSPNSDQVVTQLRTADLVMDLLNRKVTRNGQEIDLQTREFRLLEYLLKHKGQVITRTMLLEHVWDYHFDPQTNVIDVHISRLRGKIDKEFDLQLIKTVRGSGYIIEDLD